MMNSLSTLEVTMCFEWMKLFTVSDVYGTLSRTHRYTNTIDFDTIDSFVRSEV